MPKLKVQWMSQCAAQSWQPSADCFSCWRAWWLFSVHTQPFYPPNKKDILRGAEKMDKNRGLELGNLKKNRKKNKGIKEESKIWQSMKPRMDFYFSFSSSKNLNPSALYKPWTCSNSSFVDFPDNWAAESHLIHLWDLVRTSKYNRLQNTWNCWHCKHFLPNSVGQQTQSWPCNYIPPQSTFAVM